MSAWMREKSICMAIWCPWDRGGKITLHVITVFIKEGCHQQPRHSVSTQSLKKRNDGFNSGNRHFISSPLSLFAVSAIPPSPAPPHHHCTCLGIQQRNGFGVGERSY